MATKAERVEWRQAGERACPCCGVRYRVETARTDGRAEGFARCEACGGLLDEWVDASARRFVRVANERPVAAAAEQRL